MIPDWNFLGSRLLCAPAGQKYLLEQNFWMVRKYLVCAQENICVTKIIRSDRVAPGCLSRDGGRKISLRLQSCHLSIMKQLDKESQSESTIASLTKSMSNYAKPKNVSSLILILKFSSLMNNITFFENFIHVLISSHVCDTILYEIFRIKNVKNLLVINLESLFHQIEKGC